jgi:hypothetical protein
LAIPAKRCICSGNNEQSVFGAIEYNYQPYRVEPIPEFMQRKCMPILILKRLLMLASLVHKLNSYFQKRHCNLHIIPVHDQAHSRFDATKRTYEYHINTFKDAFRQEHSWYFHQPLDINLMNEAGPTII